MGSAKEFIQCDEVAERFAHLGTVNRNHVIVHPVMHHVIALRGHRLSDLAFVMREYQVHTSSVNIEVFS